MANSTGTSGSKSNGGKKNNLGTFRDVVEDDTLMMSDDFDHTSDLERDLDSSEKKRVGSARNFIQSHWKTIVPIVAALGVGAVIMNRNGSSKTH